MKKNATNHKASSPNRGAKFVTSPGVPDELINPGTAKSAIPKKQTGRPALSQIFRA